MISNFILLLNSQIYIVFLVICIKTMYFISVVKVETFFCFLLYYYTTTLFRKTS